jgi:hypothetical protein
MTPETHRPDPKPPLRASDLLGRTAHHADGRPLGRVVDIVTEPDERGRPRVTAAIVVRGPWGRLLGYERDREARGPWLLQTPARMILRREMTTVPWPQLRLD